MRKDKFTCIPSSCLIAKTHHGMYGKIPKLCADFNNFLGFVVQRCISKQLHLLVDVAESRCPVETISIGHCVAVIQIILEFLHSELSL